MKTEPSVIIGIITALVAACINVAVAFGLNLTDDQQQAILGFTAVAAPLIAAVIIRFNVYAPATVEKISDQQYAAGVPPTEPQPDIPPPGNV